MSGKPAVVRVATEGGPFEGVSAAVVRRRALRMLAHLGLEDVELSVALVDDRRIRALNKRHRKKDKATDVLAFSLGDEMTGLLGDVVLSVDTARRQAGRARRPLLDELTMLLAHGLLHLVGFDHETDEQERVMNGWTQQLQAAAAGRTRTGPARKSVEGRLRRPRQQ